MIDFLRMDKYVMLVEKILNNFIEIKIENSLFKDILVIFDFLKQVINTTDYNYSFVSIIHKILAQLSNKFNEDIYISKDFDLFTKNLIEVSM